MLRHVVRPDGTPDVVIQTQSDGMSAADIALTVEAWARKFRKALHNARTRNLPF
jgi:hypothetical protein